MISISWLLSLVSSYIPFHWPPQFIKVRAVGCLLAPLSLTNPRTNDFHPPQSWSSQPSAKPQQWFSFQCTGRTWAQLITTSTCAVWNPLEGTSSEGWEVLIWRPSVEWYDVSHLEGGRGRFSSDSFLFLCRPNIFLQNTAWLVWMRFPSKVLGRMIGPGGFDISCSRASHKQRGVKSMLLSHFQTVSPLGSDTASDPPHQSGALVIRDQRFLMLLRQLSYASLMLLAPRWFSMA